jgi:hypothetical protein
MSVIDLPAPARVLDEGDGETAEIAIYACGTHVPGLVFEPCQHSVLMVTCCACAGCGQDLWSCGRGSQTCLWYETQRVGQAWESYVRSPAAMVIYALMTLFLLSSGIVATLVRIVVFLIAVEFEVLVFLVTRWSQRI